MAHGRGVIHRDLTPANIKLTPDGQVKVLDFGLAKALEPASAGVEPTATVTAPVELTDACRVMGTVAYMSPEQASARPVDQRTDLWAFGCVVYEMLTGTRAFEGDTTTEVLVRVLDREPDWSALPPATPEIVRSLLRQCLAKDPRCRMHHAADARLQLDDALARPAAGDAATGLPRRARSRVLLAGAAGGLLVAATLVGVWMSPRTQLSAPARFLAGAAFLATGFLAAGFLAGAAFLATGYLAAGFLAGAAFLAAGFLAAGFLAGAAFLPPVSWQQVSWR